MPVAKLGDQRAATSAVDSSEWDQMTAPARPRSFLVGVEPEGPYHGRITAASRPHHGRITGSTPPRCRRVFLASAQAPLGSTLRAVRVPVPDWRWDPGKTPRWMCKRIL